MTTLGHPNIEARPRRRARLAPRRRLRKLLSVSHRWIALTVGLLLLVITTSGALLLFKPDIEHALHPSLFRATPSAHPLSAVQALEVVRRAHPRDELLSAGRYGDVWGVPNADYTSVTYVDPGTGRILGSRGDDGVFRFLDNLHECALSCAGMPGHIAWLEKPMPGLGIQGLHKVTIASFILGVGGVAFIVLVAGGLVLWWPGVRRWRRGVQLRRAQGTYKRNYDLHKLVGFVALPMLALWAVTGTNFELPVLRKATDAVLPGKSAPDDQVFRSLARARGTPDIGVARAQRAALATTGGGRIVNVSLPDPRDQTAAYSFCVDQGVNWWRAYDGCPAGKFISVDRHDATRVADTWHTDNVAQAPYGKQTEAMHFGAFFALVPRIPILLLGLTPLLLAWTGVATWLHRRRRARAGRRRRRRAAEAVAA